MATTVLPDVTEVVLDSPDNGAHALNNGLGLLSNLPLNV